MRKLRLGLFIVLSLALIGCEGPAALSTPTPVAQPSLSAATSTTTPPPTPAWPMTAVPALTPTIQSGVVGPLMADGNLVKALLAAPGSPVRYALLTGGLARSDDGGQSWQLVSELALPQLLVSPHDPHTLYAGDMAPCYADGDEPVMHRSRDGGENWQELAAGRGVRPVAEHPAHAGTIYGISCLGLHVSTDAGKTWQTSGSILGLDITGLLPLAGEPLRFLAVLTSEGGASRLAWFDEAGRPAEGTAEELCFWGQGALAQAEEALYVANSTGVWRSDDGSGQWRRFNDGLADVVLAVDPLEDGVSVEDAQRGFGLLALAVDPARPERLVLGTVRGLYISNDRGEHWRPLLPEALGQTEIREVVWDPAAPNTLYATAPQGVYAVRLPAD